MRQDVSSHWSAPCIEYNKGTLVGGPFDGKEYSFLFFPGDYPEGWEPSREDTNVCRKFSKGFPEGAVYHWNEKREEWSYIGPMETDGEHRRIFDAFGVEPEPPL